MRLSGSFVTHSGELHAMLGVHTAIYSFAPCVWQVHSLYDEKTLGESYHTRELLLADERVRKMVAYMQKQHVVSKDETLRKGFRYGR